MSKTARRRGKPWTIKEIQRLAELYTQGLTYKEIGQELGRSVDGVRNARYRFEISDPKRIQTRVKWTEDEVALLKEMCWGYYSYREIGEALGRSTNAAKRKACEEGFSNKMGRYRGCARGRAYLEDTIERILNRGGRRDVGKG